MNLRVVLESFGYSVVTAEDGEDAVAKYIENSNKVQLAILDMIMPHKSGKAAYEDIRTIRPDVKAVFVSGYTMDLTIFVASPLVVLLGKVKREGGRKRRKGEPDNPRKIVK